MKAWTEDYSKILGSTSSNISNVSNTQNCMENVPPTSVTHYSHLSPTMTPRSSMRSLLTPDSNDSPTISRSLLKHRAASARRPMDRRLTSTAKWPQNKVMTSSEILLPTDRLSRALMIYGEPMTKEPYYVVRSNGSTKIQGYHSPLFPSPQPPRTPLPATPKYKEITEKYRNSPDICSTTPVALNKKTLFSWAESNRHDSKQDLNMAPSPRWAIQHSRVGRSPENVHLNIPIDTKGDRLYDSIDTERLLAANLSDPAIIKDLADKMEQQQSDGKFSYTPAPPASPRENSPSPLLEIPLTDIIHSNDTEISHVTSDNQDFDMYHCSLNNSPVLKTRKKKYSPPLSHYSKSPSPSSSSHSSPTSIKHKTFIQKENLKNDQIDSQMPSKSSGITQDSPTEVTRKPVQLLCKHSGRLLHNATLIRTNSLNYKSQSKEKSLNDNSSIKEKIFLPKSGYNPIEMVYSSFGTNNLVPETHSTISRHLQEFFTKLYQKQKRSSEIFKAIPSHDLGSQNIYKTIKTLEFNSKGPQEIVEKMLIGEMQRKHQRPKTTGNLTNSKTFRKMKQRPFSGPSQYLCTQKNNSQHSMLPELEEVKEKGMSPIGQDSSDMVIPNISNRLDSSIHYKINHGVLKNSELHQSHQSEGSFEAKHLNKSEYHTNEPQLRSEDKHSWDMSNHSNELTNSDKSPYSNDYLKDKSKVGLLTDVLEAKNDRSIWKQSPDIEEDVNIDTNITNQSKCRSTVENDENKVNFLRHQYQVNPEEEKGLNSDIGMSELVTEKYKGVSTKEGEKLSLSKLDIEKRLEFSEDKTDMIKYRTQNVGSLTYNDEKIISTPCIEKELRSGESMNDEGLVKFQSKHDEVHDTDLDIHQLGDRDINNHDINILGNSTVHDGYKNDILDSDKDLDDQDHNIHLTESEIDIIVNNCTDQTGSSRYKSEGNGLVHHNVPNTNHIESSAQMKVAPNNLHFNTELTSVVSETDTTPNRDVGDKSSIDFNLVTSVAQMTDITEKTDVMEQLSVLHEQGKIQVLDATKRTGVTQETDVTQKVSVIQEPDVTQDTDVMQEADVIKETDLILETGVTKIDVTQETDAIEKTDIIQEPDILQETDGTQIMMLEVDVTEGTGVTQEVDVTEETCVTQEADVTEETSVTQEADVTEGIGVTQEVDVTEEIGVTQVVDVTEEISVTQEVDATEKIGLTQEVDVTEETDVTQKPGVMQETGVTQMANIRQNSTLSKLKTEDEIRLNNGDTRLEPKSSHSNRVHFKNVIEEINIKATPSNECEITTLGKLEENKIYDHLPPLEKEYPNESKIPNTSSLSEEQPRDSFSKDGKLNKRKISQENAKGNENSDLELISEKLKINNKDNVDPKLLVSSTDKRENLPMSQEHIDFPNSLPHSGSLSGNHGQIKSLASKSTIGSNSLSNHLTSEKQVGTEKIEQKNIFIKRDNLPESSFLEQKDFISNPEMTSQEDAAQVIPTENMNFTLSSSSLKGILNHQDEPISTALVPPPKLKSKKRLKSSKKSKSDARRKSSQNIKPFVFTSVQPQEPTDNNDKECVNISNELKGKGVNIAWTTLRRGLYPPTGRPLHYKMNLQSGICPESDLLYHPQSWFPKEFNALQKIVKKLRESNRTGRKTRSSPSSKNTKRSGRKLKRIKKK